MSSFERQYSLKEDDHDHHDWKVVKLPTVDSGYYDTLVAIGFGALADSYYDSPSSPLIEWTAGGFKVHYVEKLRSTPNLKWLKYSLAASWKGSLDEGVTKVAKGWGGKTRLEHKGMVVDTSEKPMVQVEVDGKKKTMVDPNRSLYGVINKLGKPDWVNLCINACRNKGIDLITDNFEEKSVTLNSIVFPQSSKGANSKSSYSIGNSSMPKSFSRPISRLTCLAVAGLCCAAIGENPTGFAVPIPQRMRIGVLKQIAIKNRTRYYYGGFFFPFNNYLNFLKLLFLHSKEFEVKLGETPKLRGVTGVNFVELGNSASPAGTWQLMAPSHKYSIASVEDLQGLLVHWRREKRPSSGGDPSIDRKAVRTLMNGFEVSSPQSVAEGYLQYLDAVGLVGNYNLLNQTFFEEIMAHKNKYQELLKEFQSEEVQRFIQLLRQDTIQKVYGNYYEGNGSGEKQKDKGKKQPPNYQIMRKLREVQSSQDFMETITEIAVERGSNKLASAQSSKDEMQHMSLFYQASLEKLIALSDKYSARLVAQLLLAFALSTKKSKN